MPEITKKQERAMMKVLKRMWPDAFIGKEIEPIEFLQKERGDLQGRVEDYIRSHSKFIEEHQTIPVGVANTLNGIARGIIGTNTKIYEVRGQGVLLYFNARLTNYHYAASVRLVGFNERTKKYKELKQDLEYLSQQSDEPEVAKFRSPRGQRSRA